MVCCCEQRRRRSSRVALAVALLVAAHRFCQGSWSFALFGRKTCSLKALATADLLHRLDNSLEDMSTSERWRVRFEEYADGLPGSRAIGREGLRGTLECTESFCLAEPWLQEEYVDEIMATYAREGQGPARLEYEDFLQLAKDGHLLCEGNVDDYEMAFTRLDKDGNGWLDKKDLMSLFQVLGKPISQSTLDMLIAQTRGSAEQEGKLGFTEFLHTAGRHLDLKETFKLLAKVARHTSQKGPAASASLVQAPYGQVTRLRSEEDLDSVVARGDDVVVQLAFSWCKPCKKFAVTYERLAATYTTARFIKIVGNDNESTRHYGKVTIGAKTSPLFVAYRNGKMVTSWTGINEQRFRDNLAEHLG